VQGSGAKIISEPAELDGPAGGYGFRAFDPDGHAFEVVADSAQRTVGELPSALAAPLRISHVVLHSPAHKALEQWYRDVLGFRLSDWLGDFMVFLRCNPAHHRLAILPGPPALNHIAFDVASIDALMRGLARMNGAGIELQWGPGRHTAGNNTFTYYTTPTAIRWSTRRTSRKLTRRRGSRRSIRRGLRRWTSGAPGGSFPETSLMPKWHPIRRCSRCMVASALVIGGGIAGMSAALVLSGQGVAVDLIDADPEWRTYGAGISVTGTAARARRSGLAR
jgi:catechol 2,3-dioxygenase-like lactoylglutathione lyase family enzyme